MRRTQRRATPASQRRLSFGVLSDHGDCSDCDLSVVVENDIVGVLAEDMVALSGAEETTMVLSQARK